MSCIRLSSYVNGVLRRVTFCLHWTSFLSKTWSKTKYLKIVQSLLADISCPVNHCSIMLKLEWNWQRELGYWSALETEWVFTLLLYLSFFICLHKCGIRLSFESFKTALVRLSAGVICPQPNIQYFSVFCHSNVHGSGPVWICTEQRLRELLLPKDQSGLLIVKISILALTCIIMMQW